ncbi:MAG: AAA family ATPase [Candidatus Micrarchaeia archaeon]
MDEKIFSELIITSENQKSNALNYPKKRYLYQLIKNTPKEYFAGISGLRGIGKTIMLTQLSNEFENSVYFSADSSILREYSLYEIVKYLSSKNYKNIFIDEIHYKQNWEQDLKTIYDENLSRIFFSGSSAIQLKKGADLSRRALLFSLNPLSFREFLEIKKGFENLKTITLKELLDFEKRKKLITKTSKLNEYLQEYYKFGGLILPQGDQSYLYKSIEGIINKIIHWDLEYLRTVNLSLENDILKILSWIAISPAGEVNYSSLSSKISITKPTLIKLIDDLFKLGVIIPIFPCGKAQIRKEPKIYLSFPLREYFCSSLFRQSDIGSLREEFFTFHTRNICYFKTKRGKKIPDFLFEGKRFEIGGESKSLNQNPDYLVKDSTIIEEKTIPLYLFGFLY